MHRESRTLQLSAGPSPIRARYALALPHSTPSSVMRTPRTSAESSSSPRSNSTYPPPFRAMRWYEGRAERSTVQRHNSCVSPVEERVSTIKPERTKRTFVGVAKDLVRIGDVEHRSKDVVVRSYGKSQCGQSEGQDEPLVNLQNLDRSRCPFLSTAPRATRSEEWVIRGREATRTYRRDDSHRLRSQHRYGR